MFDDKEVLKYFKKLPQYKKYEDKTDDEVVSYLFDAYENIRSIYPDVKISNRMIVKQMLFEQESEQSGIGFSHRHGLQSRKINDASITLSENYNMFDPYVWRMIEAQTGGDKSKGLFGRLV